MNKERIPVSVLMSLYAQEQSSFLKVCLQSVVDQTVSVTEVVLVLDGPIGSELNDCIKTYAAALPIKVVKLEENRGLATALNFGLGFCSEELIIRVDTDDINYSDRFKLQYEFMEKNKDICVSSGQVEEFTCNPNKIVSRRLIPLLHEELVVFAKRRSPMNHPAVIFRRSEIKALQGYPDIYPEDYLLWWKIILSGGKIANLSETLVKMRTNESFFKRRGFRFLRGELKLIRFLRRQGVLSRFEFTSLVIGRFILRASPPFLRTFMYKNFR